MFSIRPLEEERLRLQKGWLIVAAVVLATAACVRSNVDETTSASTKNAGTAVAAAYGVSNWSRVPAWDSDIGGAATRMWSVTAAGPGLVAVGEADSRAAVWTSVDGVSWSRVPHDDALFGSAGVASMSGVTAGGPGLVAVGNSASSFETDVDAAVWTSADGVSWSRAPHDESVFGGADRLLMSDVAVGGPGLVAVGSSLSGDDVDAAIWTSSDGVSWSRVPHDALVFGGVGSQVMSSVTAGGPGLVVVGSDASGDEDAAVWTSVDGVSWSRVPHDESVFGGVGFQSMKSVAAGGPGLVAVGYDGQIPEHDAAVWTSSDGVSWSRVPHNDAILGGGGAQVMFSVAASASGLVAVGDNGPVGDQVAAVWASLDGVTWIQFPHDEGVFGGLGSQVMSSVAVGGPGLVAVGWQGSSGFIHPAVWLGTAEP